MSSNVQHIDFGPRNARMLREILKRAGYETHRMKPLSGSDHAASVILLARFTRQIQSTGG